MEALAVEAIRASQSATAAQTGAAAAAAGPSAAPSASSVSRFEAAMAANAPQGVWTVFPVRPYDHLTFMGSIFNENGKEVNAFYHDVFYNIVYCGG